MRKTETKEYTITRYYCDLCDSELDSHTVCNICGKDVCPNCSEELDYLVLHALNPYQTFQMCFDCTLNNDKTIIKKLEQTDLLIRELASILKGIEFYT